MKDFSQLKFIEWNSSANSHVIMQYSPILFHFADRCGFIGEWRRANVTMTRAKRALIVYGSASTLSVCLWGEWMGQAKWWVLPKLKEMKGYYSDRACVLEVAVKDVDVSYIFLLSNISVVYIGHAVCIGVLNLNDMHLWFV